MPKDLVVRHRVIVRGAGGDLLLAAGRPDRPHLPTFMSGERHTAEVDYINAAMANRFGVATTVLRSLSHSGPVDGIVDRSHELEVRDATRPAELQWIAADASMFQDPKDRGAIERWQRERASDRDADAVDGREWTRPGWFDEVRVWIDDALADAGLDAAEEVRQLRNWASSSVLWVSTATGEYYFKALPISGRVESALTQYLGLHFGSVVPRLVAMEPARRWLLTAACAGQNLEDIRDVALWELAAERYGRLQVDCVPRVADLAALGCQTLTLDSMSASIRTLADVASVRQGGSGGLTHDECRNLRAAVPSLQRRCEELATCGIPLTLEHGDFWPGNVFVGTASCEVIDWEDAAIAHPFFSLAPLTVGLLNTRLGERANVERIEAAYLKAFEPIAPPDRLRRALRLAEPLCFLDMASRYSGQRASIVALHPWMRDLVPQSLRLALSRQ